ncbi:hypothetical protein GYB22_08945 [bacterium]|nr:hypothetical protein [bacterium]
MILEELIQHSKDNNKVIGITTYTEPELMWCGIVKDFNEDFISFEHYSEFGDRDGLIVEGIDNISDIQIDTEYLKGLSYLIAHPDALNFKVPKLAAMIKLEAWPFDLLNQFLNNWDYILALETTEDRFVGIITQVDEFSIKLQLINENGYPNGTQVIRSEDIANLKINGRFECKRLALYKWRNSGDRNSDKIE